jgi:hypothetical protein
MIQAFLGAGRKPQEVVNADEVDIATLQGVAGIQIIQEKS